MQEEYEQAWKVALDAPLSTAAQNALDKLAGVDSLLKEANSDGVRQLLTSPEMLSMGTRITPRKPNPVMGAWVTCKGQPKCKELLDDARNSINQLEEWCFSNRVEFYNTADQAQVIKTGGVDQALEKIKASLEEPMEFLESSKETIRQILKVSKTM